MDEHREASGAYVQILTALSAGQQNRLVFRFIADKTRILFFTCFFSHFFLLLTKP
jgi:hypothetical protein